ncbi:MAG: aspartate--tRNA(Asn) ligase [Candidatus Falkowbacteria bacterium]
MERLSILEAKKQVSGQVTVSGFVRTHRALKGLIFIVLTDLSDSMQLVIEEKSGEVYNQALTLNLESVIEVSGVLQPKPVKAGQNPDFELLVADLKILSLAKEQLPIPVSQKADNQADFDLRFNWRFLDLRQKENQLIFKVWTELERGFREYLASANYIQIYTPTFMSTSSETGADVFEVKYFDKKAYLAQSPQFYKQMAMASGLERVFMVGTVYRAEKSFTNRHVTEFTGWDFEISYVYSEESIMDEEEKMIEAGFKNVKDNLGLDIQVPQRPFPRLTLAQAKEKLVAKGIKGEAIDDLNPEEERGICEIIKEETGNDFVFITAYPISVRPFYHMRREEDNSLTKSYDLLYKGIEITTGAVREHRIEVLEKQALEKNMSLEELADYLNFFRYGCPPHGGAGIGPARIVMKMLDLNNIKEAIFLPRDVKRLIP